MTELQLFTNDEFDFDFSREKKVYRLNAKQRVEKDTRERRCIQIGLSTVQGPVFKYLPNGCVIIEHMGDFVTGRPVPQYVRGQS